MVNSPRPGVEPGTCCLLSQDTISIQGGDKIVTNFTQYYMLAGVYVQYSTHRYYLYLQDGDFFTKFTHHVYVPVTAYIVVRDSQRCEL